MNLSQRCESWKVRSMDKALIDLLFMSQKRKDLLLLLKNGGKKIEEIVDTLNVTPTGMLPQIKKLKDEHLVLQEDKEYRLTPLAEILVEKMEPLLDTLQVIEENVGYWQERDLTALPREFLERLNELKSYFIVRPDPDNIFEPPAIFLENIEKSRKILSFSSIFHPIISEIFLANKDDDTEITLIVTEKIYERLKTDFEEELRLYLTREKKKLFLCTGDIKIAMIVKTERFMAVDFLTSKGSFDQETLICFEPAALKWAEDLILHYQKQAQEIKG
ncbi:MAG TPA: winged helix-turn-helix domain-containing protein [Methanosarcina thermophila]|nr:winged helix-turn-helix domain-containing protein [Methanosarcina thermophila]HPZ19291.1 winged helix-turn-helix domain-containing protein [Methanosarcina thermophila]HQD93665.1 winged helix-turn-helix domain-containing protein [Methanosarcina thermophila]